MAIRIRGHKVDDGLQIIVTVRRRTGRQAMIGKLIPNIKDAPGQIEPLVLETENKAGPEYNQPQLGT